MRFSKVSVLVALVAIACSGSEGPEGPTGPIGPTGPTGPAAQDAGSLSGVVKDAAGAALAGVALTTVPASKSTTSAADGSFTLADVLVGSYSVVAKKAGYADATLAGVGVAAGATTADLALTMTAAPVGTGSLSGTVRNAKGDPIEGAIVTSLTTPEVTATTDAAGAFTLASVPAGFIYVKATPPAGTLLLPTETRDSKYLAGGGSVTGVNLTFSGRPADAATYVGLAGGCGTLCHTAAQQTLEAQSAHHRSLATDTSEMIDLQLWPAVGATVVTGKKALGPDGTTANVDVYLCQNAADAYSMKFGGNADCMDGTGTLVPVSGTYGGVGSTSNYGVYKQRFFAKLADVPAAAGWIYTAGKDKDYLILPIQITQSGNGSPLLDVYKNNDWSKRSRTFSRACSGCHVVGLEITYDGADNNVVTDYDYKALNVGCESCHGPGSEHMGAPSKLNILTPNHFTQTAQGELCGMCHSGDEGHSMVPLGASAFPFNRDNEAKLGGGNFVPGVYQLVNYIEGYDQSFTAANPRGSVEYWPDGIHGKPHRQQLPMLQKSVHWTNPYDKMTCANCHNVHSLDQGPTSLVKEEGANEFDFVNATFRDNTLCLSCHATKGPFADISVLDVAAVAVDGGGSVDKDGVAFVPTATESYDGRVSIAGSVGAHMEQTVKMGVAAYTPLNESSPVGRCTSCHMPKTAKSGGWTSVTNDEGEKALAHGDQASHVFDVIWPAQSAALNKTGATWDKIMPNSCGSCHAGALIYFP